VLFVQISVRVVCRVLLVALWCGHEVEVQLDVLSFMSMVILEYMISVRVVCRVLPVALWCGHEVEVQFGCTFLYVIVIIIVIL
jgi:ethanolamine transporter EutH